MSMDIYPDLEYFATPAKNWCDTTTKVDYCSYVWTIHQFFEYHYQNKQEIDSTWFQSTTNNKHKWMLKLSTPYSNMMDAMILMKVEAGELLEDILVRCKLSIINSRGEEANIHVLNPYQKLTKFDSIRYYARFPNFLNGKDIVNEEKMLLIDDKLTLFFQMYFIANKSGTINVTLDSFVTLPNQLKDGGLQEDFEDLFKNKDFCDFTVSINGKNYPVHKTILAARSKVFASMFKQKMKETNQNFMEICDMDEGVFEEMLRYMYTGKSPNLGDMPYDLLSVAEKYDLKHLKTMCELTLVKNLSIETAIDLYTLADMFQAALLKQQAIQFIKLNISAVKKSEKWPKIQQAGFLNEIFNAFFP